MPRQYAVCGRPVPRLGTRHVSLLLVGLALFAVFSLLFTLPAARPASPGPQAAGHRFSVPSSLKSPWINKLNPFKPPSRPPARDKNDSDGDSSWYANLNWLLMPFSSSVTLDENRSLLPVLKPRTPVYCYYDNTVDKNGPAKDAESDLLLTWRRAWWAQGFKPVILGPAEAMNNPLYEELQKLQDMAPELKTDLMRWLAWENMGNGVLAHRLLFPMGPHDDPLLTYLRRGEYPELTRFKNLDDGLFVGSGGEVATAIKAAMASPDMKEALDIVAAVGSGKGKSPFTLDDTPKSLAYYSARQVDTLYPKVGEAITTSQPAGLESLAQLINSHLHLTWQNIFADGISIVKPLPHHTTHLIKPAYDLAQRLAHCPKTPLPKSCPPNRPNCRPCNDLKPVKTITPSSYSESAKLYTIGTVPHPYTSSTLSLLKHQLSIAWIRRDSPRDPWITWLMSSLFPDSMSATPRLLRFKEAVASNENSISPVTKEQANGKGTRGGAFRSLWLIAEQPVPDDLEWHFGFYLAPEQEASPPTHDTNTNTNTNTNPNIPPLHPPKEGPLPTAPDLALEPALLAHAQAVVQSAHTTSSTTSRLFKGEQAAAAATKEDLALLAALEAWNLADTEAWRFARAYLARGAVERRTWEEEEARYVGGVGMGKKKGKGGGEEGGEGQGEGGEKKEKEKEKGDEDQEENGGKGRKGKAKGGGWGRWLDRA